MSQTDEIENEKFCSKKLDMMRGLLFH